MVLSTVVASGQSVTQDVVFAEAAASGGAVGSSGGGVLREGY
ncbi:MAG: hypothetical protein ABR971_08615 [Acidobacteriaceae bacterium]